MTKTKKATSAKKKTYTSKAVKAAAGRTKRPMAKVEAELLPAQKAEVLKMFKKMREYGKQARERAQRATKKSREFIIRKIDYEKA